MVEVKISPSIISLLLTLCQNHSRVKMIAMICIKWWLLPFPLAVAMLSKFLQMLKAGSLVWDSCSGAFFQGHFVGFLTINLCFTINDCIILQHKMLICHMSYLSITLFRYVRQAFYFLTLPWVLWITGFLEKCPLWKKVLPKKVNSVLIWLITILGCRIMQTKIVHHCFSKRTVIHN